MNFLPLDITPERIPARERVLLGLWLVSNRGLALARLRNLWPRVIRRPIVIAYCLKWPATA